MQKRRKKAQGSRRKSTAYFSSSRAKIFPTLLSPAVDSGEVTRRKSPSTIDKQKCTDFTSPSAFSWPYTQTSRCVSERGGCSHSSTLSPSGTRLVRRRRPPAASRARVSRWPSVCLRAAPCPATVPQVGRVSRFHLRVSGFHFISFISRVKYDPEIASLWFYLSGCCEWLVF